MIRVSNILGDSLPLNIGESVNIPLASSKYFFCSGPSWFMYFFSVDSVSSGELEKD